MIQTETGAADRGLGGRGRRRTRKGRSRKVEGRMERMGWIRRARKPADGLHWSMGIRPNREIGVTH